MTGTAAETLDAIARQLGLRIIRGERVVARDRWGRASEDSILEHFTDRRGLDELRGSVDGVPLQADAHPAEDVLDVFVRRSFALDVPDALPEPARPGQRSPTGSPSKIAPRWGTRRFEAAIGVAVRCRDGGRARRLGGAAPSAD